MKKAFVSSFMVLAGVSGFAASASAATILLNNCNIVGLCDQVRITTTLAGSDIDVSVTDEPGAPTVGIFGSSGANLAFAFNVVGSEAGLAVTNITPGFSFFGFDANVGGPFGDFEVVLSGPPIGSGAMLPLYFTVTRDIGFASDLQLFEANAAGYFFNAHVRNNVTGLTGFAAASGTPGIPGQQQAPPLMLPEPATLSLFGVGLAGLAARRLRRQRN